MKVGDLASSIQTLTPSTFSSALHQSLHYVNSFITFHNYPWSTKRLHGADAASIKIPITRLDP
jgi:hypothetical protein